MKKLLFFIYLFACIFSAHARLYTVSSDVPCGPRILTGVLETAAMWSKGGYSSRTIFKISLPDSAIEVLYDVGRNGTIWPPSDSTKINNTGAPCYSFPNEFTNAATVTLTAPLRATSEFTTGINVETSPPEDCKSSTFFMKVPAPDGANIELKKIQTLTNTDFVVAGSILFADNHSEGMLVRIDNSGAIKDQKTIRINDKPTTIFDVKALATGPVFITGTVNDGSNTVFAGLLNKDLTVNTIRTIAVNALPQQLTAGIIDLNAQIMFAVSVRITDAALAIVLNNDMSVKWMSQVTLPGLNSIVGFSSYGYGPLALITNCSTNGKKNIISTELNFITGLVNATTAIEDGNWESIGLASSGYNASIRLLGIRKNSSNVFEVFRNNLVNASKLEFRHRYTLAQSINLAVSGALDNAGDAMAISSPTGKLIFIKQFAYYQTKTDHVREYNIPLGSAIQSVSRGFDGGYLFGLNTNSLGEIILIKTDSAGILPACGYADVSSNFTEEVQQDLYSANSSAIKINIGAANSTSSIHSLALAPVFNCKETYCPPAPVEDTCLSSYFKILRSNSYSDGFSQYYLMRNNVHLVSTRRLDRAVGAFNTETSGLKLFDERGRFLKGVSVWFDTNPANVRIKKVTDSTFITQSYTTVSGIPTYTFTLMNDDLQALWSKSFKTYSNFEFNNNGASFTVHRDEDGGYYFAAVANGFLQPAGVMAIKLDAGGNLVWQKAYNFNASFLIMAGLTSTYSSLVIMAEGNTNSFSIRLDKATGAVLNGYSYKPFSDGGMSEPLFSFDHDRIIYASKTGNSNLLMGIFDTLGKPVLLKTIPNSSIPRASIVARNKLYVSYNYFNGTEYRDVLLKADTALNIEFFNEYVPTHYGYPSGIGVSTNGSIYLGGNYSHEQYFDPFLKKYEPDGKMGTCAFTPATPNLVIIDADPKSLSFSSVQKSIQSISIPLRFEDDLNGQAISAVVCSSILQCKDLKISGPSSVCGLNSSHRFIIGKTPGCSILPQCIVDTAFVGVEKITDTSLVLQFKEAGTTWIKIKLDAGCKTYWDSLQVNISEAGFSLDLGKDTTICESNTILLNAKKGFASYEWGDKSTDSTFSVTSAGTYWVTVTDGCSNTFNDTIIVSKAPPIAFTPLADRWKCNNDTLHLTADDGFISYAWSPAYNSSSASQQTLIVNPQKDTAYYLAAEKTSGCFIYDTVQVRVYHSHSVDLGKDTSFCQGQQVVMRATSGFSSYEWNTGATTQQITVNKTGNYSIIATTADGCYSFDTVRVINVFSNPVVSLDKNPGLCTGSLRQLDGGSFSKFLWQDGSTDRHYIVKGTGVYYVQVVDDNNCTGSDTTVINTLYSLPADFLPPNTSLCNYESLQLKTSTRYQRYLWSNGSTASFSKIERAGSYWLQVTDKNNCIGRDTIIVYSKECLVGLYVPTAFTPNKDTKNDFFRARLFGNIKRFELTVYNRWGQIVFVSNDPLKGWDGMYAGKEQDPGVFVWTCRYQLQGNEEKMERGTVTLIR